MKKNDVLEILFQGLDDFENKIRSSLKKGKKAVQPKNHIYFDSPSSFRKFMTIQKIELLTVICVKKPRTIYELAKIVDREFAAVLRDCNALEEVGFIKLKNLKDKKNSKTPQLSFPYRKIVVHAPPATYQIEFESAA